jgi:hypothetical protein
MHLIPIKEYSSEFIILLGSKQLRSLVACTVGASKKSYYGLKKSSLLVSHQWITLKSLMNKSERTRK